MNDRTSRTCLILGAASAVAVAFARQTAANGNVKFILAGRDERRLEAIRADLVARGADAGSVVVTGDLGAPDEVALLAGRIFAAAERIDEALLAYGLLGDKHAMQSDISSARTLLDVNFVSATLWCEAMASHFERNGEGRLAVVGSVAGDRGRQSNYLYGATKGGLERVCEGMAHRFAGSGRISITLIKPGFIDTPMTDHLKKGGLLWASPDAIAKVIRRAMNDRRMRVYAPWFWRWIMLVIRAVPVFVIHRTKL